MFVAVLRRNGGHPEIAQYFEEVLVAAGLEVVGQRLYSEAEGERGGPRDAVRLLQGVSDLLQSLREAIVEHEVATDEELDALIQGLAAARTVSYRTFFSRLTVEVIALVP
jgi:hypothetical protein